MLILNRAGRRVAKRHAGVTLIALALAGPAAAQVPSFGGNAQHTSTYAAPAQNMNAVRWSATIDENNTGAFAHYGSPLVTWDPASGAVGYEVQWSRSSYPWRSAGSIRTPATSAMLPLAPGTWYYRVRGINDSLRGNQMMSWSAPTSIAITRPSFKVVHG